MSLWSSGTATRNSLGLPLDTHGRAPPREIGGMPKEQRDAKLRSPEGPHDILSLAVPQPVSTRTTINLGSLFVYIPRDAKFRSPEGPQYVLSLAVPQTVSNKDTKAIREEEPGSTVKRGPPPYEVKTESPPAYMVK